MNNSKFDRQQFQQGWEALALGITVIVALILAGIAASLLGLLILRGATPEDCPVHCLQLQKGPQK